MMIENRHINKLEDQVEKDRKLIAQLRDGSTLLKQIEQLQAYNRELEAQFNTQMDMITALKKKLILVRFLESFIYFSI
jgi:inorganic pyrophosphatase